MDQAPIAQKIIQIAVKERRPIPKKIADAPDIDLGLELYFEAFLELHTCRLYEGGPIPYAAVIEYADRFGFDDEQVDLALYLVRALDNVFLDRQAEKQKRWQQVKGSHSSPSGLAFVPKK
jgi:hypothetical protein